MKIRRLPIQASLLQKIMLLLCISLIVIPVFSAAAATQRVYQYNENGRLTVMYTATQKTTYAYDKNGNLVSKQVEQGDYSSVVNPNAPTPTPAPEPTPAPTPAPAPTPEPAPDPSVVPPPVATPTVAGLDIILNVDSPSIEPTEPLVVAGWYLDPVGIQRIQVYVDDVFIGNAAMGVSREDVYKAYPSYNNHIAGFQMNMNQTIQTSGTPYTKKNKKKNRSEVVPGKFNHKFKIVFTNRNNQQKVAEYYIVLDH